MTSADQGMGNGEGHGDDVGAGGVERVGTVLMIDGTANGVDIEAGFPQREGAMAATQLGHGHEQATGDRGQATGRRGEVVCPIMESPTEGGIIMGVESYRDLVAWQKSMELVEAVYRASQQWPREELYGLTNQARRAAVSIPANIAEGHGRRGSSEMLHHLSIADGSLKELETHVLIAQRLDYMDIADTNGIVLLCAEVGRIIGGLMRSMR